MNKNLLLTTAYLLLTLICASSCSQRFMVNTLKKRNPNVLFSVDTTEPLIAITIDDGPHPKVTPHILDMLAEYGAKATFFITGSRIEGNEAIIQRMVDEGHEIANHMMTGKPSIWLSEVDFENQLLKTDSLLREFDEPIWMRPAFGFFNEQMLRQLKEENYLIALGSVYPFDNELPFVGYISNYILRHTRSGDIIILHDGKPGRIRTVKVLEQILPQLKDTGYSFVTLSELAFYDYSPCLTE